ncbi:MAG: hypothetical protein CBB72_008255 [Muricauda sp. TMED12]|nr:MAG: hypothetical protein CBB72_008255 [Muricauda sp. TMED12]
MKHYLVFFLFIVIQLLSLGCDQGTKPQIGIIKLNSVKNNILKIDIDVQTSKDTDAYVQYWCFNDNEKKDSTLFYSPISRNKDDHNLRLINLKFNTSYNFNVVAKKNGNKRVSKTYCLNTAKEAPWIPYYPDKDSIAAVNFDGYLHFHSRQVPGYMFIIDGKGQLVSYQKNEANFKVSKFTHKGSLLGILSSDTLHFTNGEKIIEYNQFGSVLFEAETGKDGIEKSFHHEIDLDDNGNIMTLVYEEKIMDLSSLGGKTKDTVRGDGILVIDHNKEIVWEWSVFDVMDPLGDEKILESKKDWLHANSLFKDKQGDYYISFRNISQIWKINGRTGDIIWKLGGEDGDFEIPKDVVFSGQHNIRINDKNELTLLDNGNMRFEPGRMPRPINNRGQDINANARSRLLKLSIDTLQMKVTPLDSVTFPKRYFTHSQGSAEYINDSLVVFCSTNTNRILFTDQNGEIVGNIPLEYSTYRVQYLEELYSTDYVK